MLLPALFPPVSPGWLLAVALTSGIVAALIILPWIETPYFRAINHESATRRKLEVVEGDKEHLLSIVSDMPEAVLIVGSNGKAILANMRWEELFGLPESMGGTASLEHEQQTRLEQLIKRTLATGQGEQEEIDAVEPKTRTIIANSAALADSSGAVVVARDISEFLRLEEIRRDFVANVSHELRTPLSAIRGLAETLQDGAIEDPEVAKPFVGRILRQCGRLEALLADLLTLSRLEHPLAGRERESVDLPTVVKESAEMLGARAAQREIEIEFDTPPVCAINGDADAIDRLVLNLLENAIKYNRSGGKVAARLEQIGDEVLFEVSDTGIGIPANSIDRLFERFYRVDTGRSRAEGGTGLGLAIVKHAAILHGGRIEVQSRLGRGTTFSVYLPCGG